MDMDVKRYGFKRSLPIEAEVKELVEVKKTPRLFRGPAKADFYQVVWLTEGCATFDIDFRQVTIRQGELLILSPNQVYGFDLTSEYEGKMILFTDAFFSQTELDSHFLHTCDILNPLQLNRTFRLDGCFLERVVGLLQEELNRSRDSMQPYIAQSYVRVLLLEAERLAVSCSSPIFQRADSTVGRRFLDEVEKHFKVNRLTEFYSGLLGVGEKILSREVKLLTGRTPKVYIASRIILEAKRLLVYSALSVKEIAIELGFDEPTNFNKFFRKHTGVTPVEFRKDSQQNVV